MRTVNSNHKPKRYSFPLPLIIRSETPILITDGKAQLEHKGDIIIRSADTLSVIFEPQETMELRHVEPKKFLQSTIVEPTLPEEYELLTKSQSKVSASGGAKSEYLYYQRERDMSFIAIIRRNEKVRRINLGSLFDRHSIISTALREFSREKPFYRRDLQTQRMPTSLKQGQRIKACLDILTHEGFLDKTEIPIGKKRKTDRYIRTTKQLP